MPAGYDYQFPFDARFPFRTVPGSELNDVVDIQVQVRKPWIPGYRLTQLRGVTSFHADPAITVLDSGGDTVFSATSAGSTYSSRAWSSEYTLHTWKRTQRDGVCQVLARNPAAGADFSGSIGLDDRVVIATPPAVTKVIVDEVEMEKRLFLSRGYNTQLSLAAVATTAPSIRRHAVVLEATPGAGVGRFPGCNEANTVKTINKRGPDANGDLALTGDGCYYYTLAGAAEIRLHNNCEPCWSCEEFVDLYEALRRVTEGYRALSPAAEQSRRRHQELSARLSAVIACRDANPLKVIPVTLSQGAVAVTFRYRNPTAECQNNVQLVFNWDGDTTPITDSGLVAYADGRRPALIMPVDAMAGKTIDWGSVPPGRTVRYRYTVVPDMVTELSVEVMVDGSPIGDPLIEPISA